MNDETTEVAGTAQPAATGEGSSQGAPEVSGLQQRINELTAKAGEATREAEGAKASFNEAMQRIARMEGQLAATTQPKAEGFDYSVFGEAADPLKKLMDANTSALQRTIMEQNGRIEAMLRGQQVQLMAARVNAPPAVAQRAEALSQGWAAKGLPLTPDDALRFAYGELAMEGKLNAPAGRASGGSPAGATMTGGVPPMVPANGGGQRQVALPSNFEDMSPHQQATFIDKNKIDFDL